ncbi:hypothetical protein Pla175_21150 [Pirellulimonas nuda]|uniref:Aerotolerance regulator N-terminal domain-containing protein n=1 Tax=Pirellulimonas nuda TaxID=2528009 RepID=A0A518DBA5_9BACT|nr:BatA domain-containing protein [Pirellulimonas nuda]QDU88733.1 hypothetical protein Pla175_21150 [Pirellulimonas nuda]
MALLFPAILMIGVPLALAPVVIHFFNPRRERQVAWAAMELLVESQRRNQLWIEVRGLVLLALRVLAVLAAALMLGRPRFNGGVVDWINPQQSTHLVVVDDSYSMSDRGLDPSVWRRALDGVRALDARVGQQSGGRLVVLRASEVLEAPTDAPLLGGAAATAEAARLEGTAAGETNVGLAPVFDRLYGELAGREAGPPVFLYALTDLRSQNIAGDGALQDSVKRVSPEVAAIRIVRCAEDASSNLTLSDVSPLPGPRAAGVEIPIRIRVQNHGPSAVADVQVRLFCDGGSLPAVQIGSAPAGGTGSAETSVRFAEPGVHRVLAELDGDAVASDNRRWLPLVLPSQQTVLVVDASLDGAGSRAIRTAIDPGQGVRTGWRAVLIYPGELSDALEREPPVCVVLADVPKLPPVAVEQVLRFVEKGGGLMLAVGPSIDRAFYNEWFFAGAESPLLALSVGRPSQMPPGKPAGVGDLSAVAHPVVRAFTGDLAPLSKSIAVSFAHSLELEEESAVRIVASLWDGRPALCLGSYGEGRVACLATHPSADVGWSSMSASPLFPIFMQDTVGYLCQPAMEPSLRTLGFGAGDSPPSRLTAGGAPLIADDSSAIGSQLGVFRDTAAGAAAFAVNVDPREGDLALPPAAEVEAIAAVDGVTVESLDTFVASVSGDPAPDASRWFLVAVLLLLAAETITSWTSKARVSSRGVAA